MVRVEIHRKPGDAACDAAGAMLGRLRAELPFDLVEVDVTRDELGRRFERDVPIVFVAGRAVLWGAVREEELRRRVGAAVREASRTGGGLGPPRPFAPRVRRAVIAAAGAGLALVLAIALSYLAFHRKSDRNGWDPDAQRLALRFGIDRANLAAPPIDLPTLDGGRFSLAAARGEVVFVNFWATWCPPCREEMPSMIRLGQELARAHPGKFRMVALSVDEGADDVRAFFDGALPRGMAVAMDLDQAVTRAYYCGARGACPADGLKFPESYIVDRNGRLVAYVVGPRDWSRPEAREFLEHLIGP
jgi:thiol-disulfide isomerase/thioredoxin